MIPSHSSSASSPFGADPTIDVSNFSHSPSSDLGDGLAESWN